MVSIGRKEFPSFIPWSDSYLDHLTGSRQVLLGFDQIGKPIIHDFRVPHMIVAGMSGYGKTDMCRLILYQLIKRFTPQQIEITIIDMKGFSYMPFLDIPHVTRIVRDLPGALDVLKSGYDEMVKRSSVVWESRKRSAAKNFKWRVILIDEAAEIAPANKVIDAEKEIATMCMMYAGSISRIGREAGIGLLYATQYPTREVIPGQIRANMDAVVCFKTEKDIHSEVALDDPIAATLPHRLPGRAIYKNNGYTMMQTPFVGKDEKEDGDPPGQMNWCDLLAPFQQNKEALPSHESEQARTYPDDTF